MVRIWCFDVVGHCIAFDATEIAQRSSKVDRIQLGNVEIAMDNRIAQDAVPWFLVRAGGEPSSKGSRDDADGVLSRISERTRGRVGKIITNR